MATYLDRILAAHRARAATDTRPTDALAARAADLPAVRPLGPALSSHGPDEIAVIAEIKRRSPSKGALNEDLDPSVTAKSYAEGGAAGLSVLTDAEFFGGSEGDLAAARAAVDLPVLRKDFTISANDVCDARLMGADAVLLIAAALSPHELVQFAALATEIGLATMVEIHDEDELDVAISTGATVLGVNQRDLVSFQVDHARAERMAGAIPHGVIKVAESGVRNAEDARRLRDAGYDAVLVGETLVTSADPAATLRELRCS